jgi:hypothetical protein
MKMREQIEKVIADLERRKGLCDAEIKNTAHAKVGRQLLENMYSSGSSDALKYAITELKGMLE